MSSPDGHRRLSFCLLTTFYPPWSFGGDGIQVRRLAHALAEHGHRVTVVCAPKVHRLLGGERPEPPAPHPGIELVRLPDGLPSLTGSYLLGRPLRSRRRLERLLGRGFDVLHFHNPSLLGAPRLLGMGAGLRLYTAHEHWLLCPSHVLLRRGGEICEDPPCWSCELAHRRPPQPWRRTGMLERQLAQLDALIVLSRSSAELHRRFSALTRLELIANFVFDPAEAAPSSAAGGRAATSGSRAGYFLYAGRLEPIKGVGTLLEVFRGRREELVIAGDGGEARRLRRAARDLPNVRCLGPMPSEQMPSLYRGATALLVPTVGYESGPPLVALEALSMGTPVVALRLGALEELIEETGGGIAYDAPAELAAALDLLAGDASRRNLLGRRGQAAVEASHSVEAHLVRYFSLIASLARGRGDEELAAAAEAAMPRRGVPPGEVRVSATG